MSELDALIRAYAETLYVVVNSRILDALMSSRGITLNKEWASLLHEAYESIANAQEAIEAVVPKEKLI